MAELATEKGDSHPDREVRGVGRREQRFDLVMFAQSFHWVDPDVALPKVRRLLTDRGHLALAWNRMFPVAPSRSDFAPIYRD